MRQTSDLVVFWRDPNDIAVRVDSMKHLPAGREPACDIREIRCDHFRYFVDDESLGVLGELLS